MLNIFRVDVQIGDTCTDIKKEEDQTATNHDYFSFEQAEYKVLLQSTLKEPFASLS